MTQESTYPSSIPTYFANNPHEFITKTNWTRKSIYILLLLLSLLLLIMPGLVSVTYAVFVRIGAGLGLLIFAFAVWLGAIDYYNKKSGSRIKILATKKFNSATVSEQYILSCFECNDFEAIAMADELDKQPLQIDIYEDAKGRIFYCQVIKWHNSSDLSGISPVKTITEPAYSKYYDAIKRIHYT